jgi:hypothetical protein
MSEDNAAFPTPIHAMSETQERSKEGGVPSTFAAIKFCILHSCRMHLAEYTNRMPRCDAARKWLLVWMQRNAIASGDATCATEMRLPSRKQNALSAISNRSLAGHHREIYGQSIDAQELHTASQNKALELTHM